MASRRRAGSELDDDAITEILLRLPPEDPARLVRASLVCQQWRRVVSDPAFLRLYARFHRTPPLLGFFITSCHPRRHIAVPRFVPVTMAASASATASVASPSSSSSVVAAALDDDCCPWLVLDCRHGRVLLQRRADARDLLVWDPVTGDQHALRSPTPNFSSMRSATVLCAAAAAGCDHSACRGGPFLVLCAGVTFTPAGVRAHACLYSSQLRAWRAPVHLDLDVIGYEYLFFHECRAVVVRDEIYLCRFLLAEPILKYDLGRHCLSLIESPNFRRMDMGIELMVTDDGLLGLATARKSRIYLWSRKVNNADTDAEWVKCKVMNLRKMVLPADRGIQEASVIGFAEGANAIFVGTNVGTFVVDLKLGQARKVCEDWIVMGPIVPFMTFYSPGCACSKLPLPMETNN